MLVGHSVRFVLVVSFEPFEVLSFSQSGGSPLPLGSEGQEQSSLRHLDQHRFIFSGKSLCSHITGLHFHILSGSAVVNIISLRRHVHVSCTIKTQGHPTQVLNIGTPTRILVLGEANSSEKVKR